MPLVPVIADDRERAGGMAEVRVRQPRQRPAAVRDQDPPHHGRPGKRIGRLGDDGARAALDRLRDEAAAVDAQPAHGDEAGARASTRAGIVGEPGDLGRQGAQEPGAR